MQVQKRLSGRSACILSAFIMLFAPLSCDTNSSGTDFDSSQYYTKVEINNLFELKKQIVVDNATGGTIADTGFANGVSITVPQSSGIMGVYFHIKIKNGTGSTVVIGLALTATNNPGTGGAYIVTLPAGGYSQNRVYFPLYSVTAGSTLKLWQDTAQADGTATASLTNITIAADVIHWVRSGN